MITFPYNELNLWFNSKRYLFNKFEQYRQGETKKQRRLFFDNDGKILLVAHIDTVLQPIIHRISKRTIYAQGLDDRLGCAIGYWLMKYLPVDLLLCDYEESGRSTAQFHDIKESYNSIIELDRGGMDFVDYGGLAENDMIDDIETLSGMKTGWGSFSDICLLDCKNIGAVNWGIGYHCAHSKKNYARKEDIQKQIRRLWDFIEIYQDRPYEKGIPTCRMYGMYSPHYEPTPTIGTKAYENIHWYKQPCEWCGEWIDVALMTNYICVNCQALSPSMLGGDVNQCDICRKYYKGELLYEGICVDCEYEKNQIS